MVSRCFYAIKLHAIDVEYFFFAIIEHIKHLMIKSQSELKDVKPEYYWQIMMSMAVLNVDCWDFVSFCEYFEGTLRMMAMEVRADESDIILLKTRILEAVNMRDEIIKKVML